MGRRRQAIERPPGEEITPTCSPVPVVALSAADPLLSLPRPLNHPLQPEATAATHVDISGVSLPGGGSPPRPVQAARRPKGGNWASLANQMTRAIKAEETVAAQHMRAAGVKTIDPWLRLRILECNMEAYLINARCVVEGQSVVGGGERRGERVVLFLRKGTHKVIPEAGVRVLVYSPWYDMHPSVRFPSGLKRQEGSLRERSRGTSQERSDTARHTASGGDMPSHLRAATCVGGVRTASLRLGRHDSPNSHDPSSVLMRLASGGAAIALCLYSGFTSHLSALGPRL